MKCVLAWVLVVACGSVLGAGPAFGPLGSFDHVVTPDDGEHCAGDSLDLWNADGRVIGLLHRHQGLCGDPPCAVLDEVSLDRDTGRLAFEASVAGERLRFKGRLQGDHVAGTLNGAPLQMDREAPVAGSFAPDTSVGAWCSFWTTVPRCRGVKELCAQLQ